MNWKRTLRRHPLLVGAAIAALSGAWYVLAGWPVLIAADWARLELPPQAFDLVLQTDKTDYLIGEKPAVTAKIINRSGQALYLVRPLDGSERGRSPEARFTITPPANAMEPEPVEMCGNTNPIDTSAFVHVPDGDSLTLYAGEDFWLAHELDRGPGEYTIQVTYATDNTDTGAWIGGPLGAVDEQQRKLLIAPYLSKVPRTRVTSNALTLRFASRYDTPVEALRAGLIDEAALALRQIAAMPQANRPADWEDAVVAALARLYDAKNYAYTSFAEKALRLVAPAAEARHADAFWNLLARERQFCERRVFLDQHSREMEMALVSIVLKSAPDQRADRLNYLLHPQAYETRYGGQRLDPVNITRDVIYLIDRMEGEDIDQVLSTLAADAPLMQRFDESERKIIEEIAASRSS